MHGGVSGDSNDDGGVDDHGHANTNGSNDDTDCGDDESKVDCDDNADGGGGDTSDDGGGDNAGLLLILIMQGIKQEFLENGVLKAFGKIS